MWKYVHRRIRDVCDRTYNLLDVRRPLQRGGQRFCAENFPEDGGAAGKKEDGDGRQGPSSSYCSLLNAVVPRKQLGITHRSETGSSGQDGEGFRRKDYCPPPQQHSWVGAITWTSAIICGWYTSQLICLYRRNHKWEGPKCLPFLITSAHRLPRNFPHCFLKAGPDSSGNEASVKKQQKTRSDKTARNQQQQQQQVTFFGVPVPTAKLSRLGEFDFERFSEVVRVVNHEEETQTKKVQYGVQVSNGRTPDVSEPRTQAPTVESATENLVTVIGEIEYQLGVQNLEVGDYATAVSHLKLGTSHQHAGAAFNLGICFEQGFGVKKNARVAMECFHLASSLGHPQAMYNLGVYYARGLGGLRRSRSMAKKYFTAAADLGLEEAIVALGPAYRNARRRDSAAPFPTFMVPFDFKLNYDELEQYGYGKMAVADSQTEPQHPELRLVTAMA